MNKEEKDYQSALHWLKIQASLNQARDRAEDAHRYAMKCDVSMVKAEIYYLGLYLEQVKQSIMKVNQDE